MSNDHEPSHDVFQSRESPAETEMIPHQLPRPDMPYPGQSERDDFVHANIQALERDLLLQTEMVANQQLELIEVERQLGEALELLDDVLEDCLDAKVTLETLQTARRFRIADRLSTVLGKRRLLPIITDNLEFGIVSTALTGSDYLGALVSENFSKGHYLQANPDVQESEVPALRHYLTQGRFEGRSAKPTVPAVESPETSPAPLARRTP